MFTEKLLSKNLKKSLTTALPILALSGFISTAAMVQVASAADEASAEQSQAMPAEQLDSLRARFLGEGKTEVQTDALIKLLSEGKTQEAEELNILLVEGRNEEADAMINELMQ